MLGFLLIFPSWGGEFPHGVLTSKRHNKGTLGSRISNFIEVQDLKFFSPFPLGGEISPPSSNPQNIKLDYLKISHTKFHQNPTITLGDTSQDRKIEISPSFEGKFSYGGL